MNFLAPLIGLIIGAVKELFMMNMQHKQQEREAWQQQAGVIHKDRSRAGKLKGGEVQFAKRLIVITMMTIIAIPAIAAVIYPDFVVNVPQTVLSGGWKFLFFEKAATEKTIYVTLTGYTYILQVLDMAWLVVAYYMGSGGTRKLL